MRRIREYNRAIEEARRRYFTGPYGTAYIELLILGTDPGYRGLGAGTALCNWGIEKAREARKKTALFAMPSSITFYSSQLGFHEVGEPIIIQVDGDPEKLEIVAMVLDWKKPSPKLDRIRSGE